METYPQDGTDLDEVLQAMIDRPRPKVKVLAEMTEAELLAELRDAEAQRQAIKYRRGPQAAQTKAWARRRKAKIRAELKQRKLPTPKPEVEPSAVN